MVKGLQARLEGRYGLADEPVEGLDVPRVATRPADGEEGRGEGEPEGNDEDEAFNYEYLELLPPLPGAAGMVLQPE